VVYTLELCWLEPEANVIDELRIFVFIRVEKTTMPEDDVIEQIIQQNVPFNNSGALIEVFVVLFHHVQPIVRPEVGVVLVYRVDKRLAQRFFREPGQQCHPAI
jgi:hypothetical protein